MVRAIAILAHPIPGTDNAQSAQIILPQRQTGRKSDIYVFCCSFAHNVCAKDKWLAFVSTTVETVDPERELAPGAPPLRRYIATQHPHRELLLSAVDEVVFMLAGLALLGPIEEKFVEVTDVYAPKADGTSDKAFISRGDPLSLMPVVHLAYSQLQAPVLRLLASKLCAWRRL